DDAAAVGALIFLRFISFFLFGPFVGLIADRFPRIRTLRFTQGGVATTSLLLGVLLLVGDVQLWHIYVYTFVNGTLFMIEISVRRPYISAVVGPKNLTAALALDMISLNVAWFIGANAGGALVAVISAGYLYTGIASTYAFNVFWLRNLPILFRKEMAADREPAFKSLKSGFNYARKNRLILGGLLVVGLNNFSGYTFESMGAVFAADVFNAGPVMFGLLMSAQGLGSLIMAAIVVRYGKRVKRPALFMLSGAMAQHIGSFAFSFVGIAMLGFVALMLLGMVSMIFGIMHNTLVLTATPDRVRGRIVGLQILAMGMFPLGSLAVGELGDAIGLQEAVRVFSGVGFAALLVLSLVMPELRGRVKPLDGPGVSPTGEPVTQSA
ncbi:MAG: MFS transporter, partial [Chloroflexi bacterium]|nr:MFS transporter [Chloroflexota bacterium]